MFFHINVYPKRIEIFSPKLTQYGHTLKTHKK